MWCSYKYLNGGPGCVGGCFVHERHAREWDMPRFAGWWGHDEGSRFQMGPEFQPMPGAEGWQLSNPPILALAPLRASLEIFSEAGMDRLREKSKSLTGYLEFLLDADRVVEVFHRHAKRRGKAGRAVFAFGCQSKGRACCDRLIHEGTIGDWREPDTLRIAPSSALQQLSRCLPLRATFPDRSPVTGQIQTCSAAALPQ